MLCEHLQVGRVLEIRFILGKGAQAKMEGELLKVQSLANMRLL